MLASYKDVLAVTLGFAEPCVCTSDKNFNVNERVKNLLGILNTKGKTLRSRATTFMCVRHQSDDKLYSHRTVFVCKCFMKLNYPRCEANKNHR